MNVAIGRSSPAPDGPLIALRRSEWETAFFGARMGALMLVEGAAVNQPERRAEHVARDLDAALIQAVREGYAHVILRAPAEDVAVIWAAEARGLHLVDVGVELSFTFASTALPDAPTSALVRFGESDDIPSLQSMTEGAFRLSRFAIDPFFTAERVSAFYKQWVANLFDGLADVVFVCELEGEPAGFISAARIGERGRIPLVATRSDRQRLGIARTLLTTALGWFADTDTRVAHVKTQAANYPALALYERAGFITNATELTFSWSASRDGEQRTT